MFRKFEVIAFLGRLLFDDLKRQLHNNAEAHAEYQLAPGEAVRAMVRTQGIEVTPRF